MKKNELQKEIISACKVLGIEYNSSILNKINSNGQNPEKIKSYIDSYIELAKVAVFYKKKEF